MIDQEKIEISIDIDQPGAMPVDILAEASGLSRTAVKDAMSKGAVWLSKQVNVAVPEEPELLADSDNQTSDIDAVEAEAAESAVVDADIAEPQADSGQLSEQQESALEAASSTEESGTDIWKAAWPKSVEKTVAKTIKEKIFIAKQGRPRRLRRGKRTLEIGQNISLYYDQKVIGSSCPAAELIADEGSYTIWHKPAGMLCQGSRWGDHTTIARWAENNLMPQRTAFVVHRIDKMTSGLVVLAHSKKAAAHISKQFADRTIEKTYKAIINQQFDSPLPLLIDTALDCKPCLTTIVSAQVVTANQLFDKGNLSLDDDGVLADPTTEERLEKTYSQLEIRIATGRKHQIRRHLNTLGYTVLGDRLYPMASASANRPDDSDKTSSDTETSQTNEANIDLQLRAVALRLINPDSGISQHYKLDD